MPLDPLISEAVRAELERRRVALATAPSDRMDEARADRVLIVEVGRERYGLPIAHVAGILRLAALAALPGLPAHVVGLTHQHGEVLGVIDIRAFFGVPRPDLTDLPLAVVLQQAGRGDRIAMLIDKIEQVVPLDNLHEPIATHTGLLEDYQLGATADGCVVLDLAHILDDPRLVIDIAP